LPDRERWKLRADKAKRRMKHEADRGKPVGSDVSSRQG
jgi:hypothetical protein